MRLSFLLFASLLTSPLSSRAQSDAPRLPAPRILRAEPAFWSKGVPASTGILSLSFDQPLRPGFTAWAGPSAILPDEVGKERFTANLKSLGLTVKLQPATVYVFGINERGKPGVGFQNDQGTAVPPHFLVFQTAGEPAPENAPPTLRESTPKNLDMAVDPSKSAALTFTFDRPMLRDSHGISLTAAGRPIDLSSTTFSWDEGGETLTLNYRTLPNTLYRATLNSTFNIGFRSEPQRIPLWPTTLTFRTTAPSEPLDPEAPVAGSTDTPPMITKSSPEFWSTAIDPAADRITLTFDQPLRPGYSAWFGPGSIQPTITPAEGAALPSAPETYTADYTTVSLPISLQRGRIYVLALNARARAGVGFQNQKGIPTPPRYLVFRTRGIPPEEHRPPEFRGITPDPAQEIPLGESGTTAVTITFDRPMSSASHGLILESKGGPVDLSDRKPTWSPDGTSVTFGLPLLPDSTYTARLNSDQNIGFHTPTGIPLWPRQIDFQTAP